MKFVVDLGIFFKEATICTNKTVNEGVFSAPIVQIDVVIRIEPVSFDGRYVHRPTLGTLSCKPHSSILISNNNNFKRTFRE